MKRKLDRKFYNRSTLKVARELLGKYLVVEKGGNYVSGKIVETEAYIGRHDPASHAYRGLTSRNKVMFGDPGYAYVYFTYGMHHCLNFVTERYGFPAATLIRALEPTDGIEIMTETRVGKRRRKTGDLKNLTNGPAKLCQALGIDRTLNGAYLCSDIIYIEDRGNRPTKIASTSRIGVKEGKDKKWRFYIDNNKFVSI
ncbi:MAG: DNA-3-methyladenine glycosylase [candidate division Zixibacteria bacterium]|nr:DNA-3-methyladenine glycosylase [candidate division Zixibacteria bacterium]